MAAPNPSGAPGPQPTPEQQARRAKMIQLLPRMVQHYRQSGPPPYPGYYMQLRQLAIIYARNAGDLDWLEQQVFTANAPAQTLYATLEQKVQGTPMYQQWVAAGKPIGPPGGGPPHPGMGGPGMRPGMGPGPRAVGTPGGAGPGAPSAGGVPPGHPSTCPYCDAPIPAGATKCPSCTAPL